MRRHSLPTRATERATERARERATERKRGSTFVYVRTSQGSKYLPGRIASRISQVRLL